MKKLTTISALIASISAISTAASQTPEVPLEVTPDAKVASEDSASGASKSNLAESYKEAINAFSNLKEAERIDFLKKRAEAGVLFSNKRIIEALELTRDMTAVFDKDPQVMNLRGACFVEIRDFPKAMQEFEKSMAITGPTVNVMFNMGEVAFVSKDWGRSKELFEKTLEVKPAPKADMQQLIEFKILLCHLGLSKDSSLSEVARTESADKALVMSKKYGFLDDTPYFYYAKASIHFSNDEEEQGQKLLERARRVYSDNKAALFVWEDTLSEYGYIKSFYNSPEKKG